MPSQRNRSCRIASAETISFTVNVNAAEDECGDALTLLRHYRETLLEGLQQKKFERRVSQIQAFSEIFRERECV